jgi:hypothetical protein
MAAGAHRARLHDLLALWRHPASDRQLSLSALLDELRYDHNDTSPLPDAVWAPAARPEQRCVAGTVGRQIRLGTAVPAASLQQFGTILAALRSASRRADTSEGQSR